MTIHPTAEVDPRARIGAGTTIWHHTQVREHAEIGPGCTLGQGVYVDVGVHIGSHCKLQNGVAVYRGATLEDGVFLGPGACLLNDRYPRAITPDGRFKTDADWEVGPVVVRAGASIGAGALILPNVSVGRLALVGAGAVVSRDVPPHALVIGTPARLVGYVCACGRPLLEDVIGRGRTDWSCPADGSRYERSGDGDLALRA